jgi:hypothetical protein
VGQEVAYSVSPSALLLVFSAQLALALKALHMIDRRYIFYTQGVFGPARPVSSLHQERGS